MGIRFRQLGNYHRQFQACDIWDARHPNCSWEHGETSLLLQYDGQAWVKFNYDMGATTTAPPWEICSSFSCVRCANSSLRKARTCPTSVEPSFTVWPQTQRGRTCPRSTHTPFALASEISRYHDAFIFEEFGGLIPRHSRVSGGLRREYHRLW